MGVRIVLRLWMSISTYADIVLHRRNWGLTEHELTTIPPSLVRGFMRNGRGGFGAELPGPFGRLLMRDQFNSELYGPLQHLYTEGKEKGTDVWIHKNRYGCTLSRLEPVLSTCAE